MLMHLLESFDRLYEGGWILPSGKMLECDHSKNLHHETLAFLFDNPEIDQEDFNKNPSDYYDPNHAEDYENAIYEWGWVRISSSIDGEKELIIDISTPKHITQDQKRGIRKLIRRFSDWSYQIEGPERFHQTDDAVQVSMIINAIERAK